MQNQPGNRQQKKLWVSLLVIGLGLWLILRSLPNNEAGAAVVFVLMLVGGPIFLLYLFAFKRASKNSGQAAIKEPVVKTTTPIRLVTIIVGTLCLFFSVFIAYLILF